MIMKFLPFGKARREFEETVVWDDEVTTEKPIMKVDERPRTWGETLLYAWQHTLVNISAFTLPLVVAAAVGVTGEAGAVWVNRSLFMMGVATLIQVTFGSRLPFMQGQSAIMTSATASVGGLFGAPAMWGGIFAASVSHCLIGLFGLPGIFRKLFPPLVTGVILASIAFVLGRLAVIWSFGNGDPVNLIFAVSTIVCVFLLQGLGGRIHPIIQRGAIAFSVIIVGIIASSIVGKMNWDVVAAAPWFAFPRFFPEGGPGIGGPELQWTFLMVAYIGIMIGVIGSIAESLGDYAALCSLTEQKYKVKHMNRGIAAEGFACTIGSIFGGIPVTSYSQGLGVIASTKIASRFVVQVAAVIMLLYGLSPKVGAFMVAMPRSVVGAVFLIVAGSILMAAVRLIATSKPTTANVTVTGFSLLVAVLVPPHLALPAMHGLRDSIPALPRLILTDTLLLAVVTSIIVYQIVYNFFGGKKEEELAKQRIAEEKEKSGNVSDG